MLRSLFSSVSALRHHLVRLDVIGNNIANVNTVGFKRSNSTFAEALAQTLQSATAPSGNLGGINPMQVGIGMATGRITPIFTQGSLETTGQVTDLAIQGEGFFILGDGQNRFYTRAGAFQFDNDGRLVSANNGFVVQGRLADESGQIVSGTDVQDIVLPFGNILPARATTEVQLGGNLDAAAVPNGTILESDRIYALELAGDDGDISGLFAAGNTNEVIDGMAAGLTTVTVTDGGTVGTRTYIYVSQDASVGDGAFNSLDDLIAEINNDFGAANSFTARLVDGRIELTNASSAANRIEITSTNAILQSALSAANGDVNAAARTTDQFLHVARGTDLLTNLRDASGQLLGLADRDEITIEGVVGSVPYQDNLLLDAASDYQALANEIAATLRLTNSSGVQIDSETGALIINGDGGTANGISLVNLRAEDAGGTERANFNSVFGASSGGWSETQQADDVRHTASIIIYDSLGNPHTITLEFTKDVTNVNRWNWQATTDSPARITSGGSGYVTFNQNGTLQEFRYDSGASSLQFEAGAGTQNPMTITFEAGGANSSTAGEGLTQFASSSTAIARSQDGYRAGALESINIDRNGNVRGRFGNGVTRKLAQIVLGVFNNPSGLTKLGDNMYAESPNAQIVLIRTPGEDIPSDIISGALEMSNVDLAQEFTNMIIAQRGFQANARVITTSDEMLTELVNLKR
jgi:flagellar hook protein FlgE